MHLPKTDRVGEIRRNKYGSIMKVIHYGSAKDILVKFVEYGDVVHTQWDNFIRGKVKSAYDKSVCGKGYIGEGIYKTHDNKIHTQQYVVWRDILLRCFDERLIQLKYPSYKDCTVCDEWLNFQTFAKWYDDNLYHIDGEKTHIDKDILIKGNKVYSPDSCIFVPKRINSLFITRKSERGDFPIGVCFDKSNNKFMSACGVNKKSVFLGYYDLPEEAFRAYKTFKEKVIKQIADEYKEKIPLRQYNAMINYEVEITD